MEQPDRNIPHEEAAGTAQTKSGGNAAHAGTAMAGQSGHGQAGASGTSTIGLRVKKPGKETVLVQLTAGKGFAHHTVIAADRKDVRSGKSVYVRVNSGGFRVYNKN